MPGCKPGFNKKAAGGKKIGAATVTIGAGGREIHQETACYGGNEMPIMNPVIETAAPIAKGKSQQTRGAGAGF